MLTLFVEKVTDPQFMGMVVVAIAVAVTAYTLVQPMLETDRLGKRMKLVSDEREQIRQRERERLKGKTTLRAEPKAYMKRIVEQFSLRRWLGNDAAKEKLVMAGFRGAGAETGYLFFGLVAPAFLVFLAVFYLFVLNALDQPFIVRIGIVIFAAFLGIKAPEIYLTNSIGKRQADIKKAWPDALDLTLICVESGMSVENSFRRVGLEIATQSVILAEELTLTVAELSFLPERRMAYENLANRVGLEQVKSVSTALIQAERYGTPIGQALRVLAQESRDIRLNEAEKKAAALPPKLTVPMILFFLPVLFVVILTPAAIQIFGSK